MTKRRRARGRGQSGVIAIIVAAGIIAFVGLAAWVIDLGHHRVIRGELHNAADSACLAGVLDLDGTDVGALGARQKAVEYASKNDALNTAVDDLDTNTGNDPDGDIVLGKWDFAAHASGECADEDCFDSTVAVGFQNAVRARTARADDRGTGVPMLLARSSASPRPTCGPMPSRRAAVRAAPSAFR